MCLAKLKRDADLLSDSEWPSANLPRRDPHGTHIEVEIGLVTQWLYHIQLHIQRHAFTVAADDVFGTNAQNNGAPGQQMKGPHQGIGQWCIEPFGVE
jgi:hypothetical protein